MGHEQSSSPSTLIGQMRISLDGRDYSENVQKAWLYWARSLLLFHESKSPDNLTLDDVEAFLKHLDSRRQMTAASRRQALKAIEFLLVDVLSLDIPGLKTLVEHCERSVRPVILSPAEVQRILACLKDAEWLMASLIYGAGLRLMECARLRVRDLEGSRIIVRDPTGRFNRETVLPERVREPLKMHLEALKLQHIRELADGFGAVQLPPGIKAALSTSRSWAWQFVFPGPYLAGQSKYDQDCRRTHVSDVDIRHAIESAARKAGIERPVSGNMLRNSFAAHLIQRGVAVEDVERLLGVRQDEESSSAQRPGRSAPKPDIPPSPADHLATH
jgi:integrase